MKAKSTWIAVATVLVAAAALQGCSTTSSRLSDDGKSDQIAFPDPASSWPKDGTFPNIDNLRMLAPGMTKSQLYPLLDRPHFNEGFFGVREWDYLFNFRTGRAAPNDIVQCQMKVVFDKNEKTRAYYWKPESCAGFLNKPAPEVQRVVMPPVVANVPTVLRNATLSGDTLFRFNGSGPGDLTNDGRRQIATLGAELAQLKSVTRVEVQAFTDRIGSASANRVLSQKRAETVKKLLVDNGVDGRVVVAEGRGKSEPGTQCGTLPRAKLIECLAPDRRVEIRVLGTK
ncbi:MULTISPECIES: outer membrane protein assembly factor BamE [Cupriavidus]|jgi:outer membrane protein assembly factor BamE (lipoprotein component of BamABCDE complex)|uniref:outer membrane protein assembly factor BamE domain-containing protein n=1 Tax=Cupriavidus TaxID=106589 RepID=UPI00046B6A4B|nr:MULTISPECIES: outer membrane protein assembly factor BamE [Cupriavidus]KWR75119.1 hypothetical protein RN01_30110 [Cupriavidus sp. SHE]